MSSEMSDTTACGICCGLLILFSIGSAISSNWASIAKNAPGILWGIAFLILLVGILYEGWKAVMN
jgi:hypothetical protein